MGRSLQIVTGSASP